MRIENYKTKSNGKMEGRKDNNTDRNRNRKRKRNEERKCIENWKKIFKKSQNTFNK